MPIFRKIPLEALVGVPLPHTVRHGYGQYDYSSRSSCTCPHIDLAGQGFSGTQSGINGIVFSENTNSDQICSKYYKSMSISGSASSYSSESYGDGSSWWQSASREWRGTLSIAYDPESRSMKVITAAQTRSRYDYQGYEGDSDWSGWYSLYTSWNFPYPNTYPARVDKTDIIRWVELPRNIPGYYYPDMPESAYTHTQTGFSVNANYANEESYGEGTASLTMSAFGNVSFSDEVSLEDLRQVAQTNLAYYQKTYDTAGENGGGEVGTAMAYHSPVYYLEYQIWRQRFTLQFGAFQYLPTGTGVRMEVPLIRGDVLPSRRSINGRNWYTAHVSAETQWELSDEVEAWKCSQWGRTESSPYFASVPWTRIQEASRPFGTLPTPQRLQFSFLFSCRFIVATECDFPVRIGLSASGDAGQTWRDFSLETAPNGPLGLNATPETYLGYPTLLGGLKTGSVQIRSLAPVSETQILPATVNLRILGKTAADLRTMPAAAGFGAVIGPATKWYRTATQTRTRIVDNVRLAGDGYWNPCHPADLSESAFAITRHQSSPGGWTHAWVSLGTRFAGEDYPDWYAPASEFAYSRPNTNIPPTVTASQGNTEVLSPTRLKIKNDDYNESFTNLGIGGYKTTGQEMVALDFTWESYEKTVGGDGNGDPYYRTAWRLVSPFVDLAPDGNKRFATLDITRARVFLTSVPKQS
ncbi:MAG: hypothetical protein LBK99_09390 [Opitutaceae bacterium]|jgi:hypothetical protein|nr:hypothetical protein [Opitutaceae bacterium]